MHGSKDSFRTIVWDSQRTLFSKSVHVQSKQLYGTINDSMTDKTLAFFSIEKNI